MSSLKNIYIDICDNYRYFRLLDNKNKLLTKLTKMIILIKYEIYNRFNIIKLIVKDNKKIYMIYSNKINNNKIEKLLENLDKANFNIIMSNDLINKLKSIDTKYTRKYLIANQNDKLIYKINLEKCISNIIHLRDENVQEVNIYILMRKIQNIELLNSFTQKCKTLNIITDNLREFQHYETSIYNNFGIPVVVSNNKRKALSKAKYIINYDYDEIEMNNWNIKRDAIIFNISENRILKLKGFEGLIINNIKIEYNKMDMKNFFNRRFRKVFKGEYKITKFIGNNGYICEEELKN